MVFRESDLLFTFPPDWIIRKYDDTVAFKSLSGHGLKGVDFLCLAPDNELWLIEVKNYRNRSSEHRAVRRSPGELAIHVGRKFSDSQRLVGIVNKFLRRKWWIRWQLRWYSYRGGARPESNHWFWSEVARRLENQSNVNCLLWLETAERDTHYESAVRGALVELLTPGNRLYIAEMQRPGHIPLRVVPVNQ